MISADLTSLSVCKITEGLKADLHEIFRNCRQWHKEQMH